MHRTEEAGNVNNLFTDGDVSVTGDGTLLSAAEFNSYQEELAHLIESSGITLQTKATDTYTQLLAAILHYRNVGAGGFNRRTGRLITTPINMRFTAGLNNAPIVDSTISDNALVLNNDRHFAVRFEYTLRFFDPIVGNNNNPTRTSWGLVNASYIDAAWHVEHSSDDFIIENNLQFSINSSGGNAFGEVRASLEAPPQNETGELVIRNFKEAFGGL